MKDKQDKSTLDAFPAKRGRPVVSSPEKRAIDTAKRMRAYRARQRHKRGIEALIVKASTPWASARLKASKSDIFHAHPDAADGFREEFYFELEVAGLEDSFLVESAVLSEIELLGFEILSVKSVEQSSYRERNLCGIEKFKKLI